MWILQILRICICMWTHPQTAHHHQSPGPKFTNDLMTILRQSCDNLGLVTIL